MQKPAPRLLVVAGHDPSGAGIDADRNALADLPIEARFVVTAHTQQDSRGVHSIGARGPDTWLAEARRELPVAAIKFGLLPGADDIRAAAELIREARAAAEFDRGARIAAELDRGARSTAAPLTPSSHDFWAIADPVLASSSGGRFLDTDAIHQYLHSLLPAGVVLTPNIPELAELTSTDPALLARDPTSRESAARTLLALGATAILVKAGHGDEDPARDLVLTPNTEPLWLAHPRIRGGKVRGSGCRFASRLCACLALGASLQEAAQEASEHVLGRIRQAGGGG